MKLETIPEPQKGQPSVRSAALLRRPPSLRLHRSVSPNLRLVARTWRWVYFHPVSGFYSVPSLLFFYYYLKEEAGCHWLSSRAQTCCGHPVRPFTFFSVPKDSCRPSVSSRFLFRSLLSNFLISALKPSVSPESLANTSIR